MTGIAAAARGNLRASLGLRRIERLAAALGRQRREMLGQDVEVIVVQVLDDRRHRLDLAHALPHQEKLVEDEERRLAGQRGNVLDLGVAVLAVTGRAKLELLGERSALRLRLTGTKQ